MVEFARKPDAEIRAAHRKATTNRVAQQAPVPPPKNVRHLIDIGNTRVFFYRSAPIAVPPVPAIDGMRVLELVQLLSDEDMTPAERIPLLRDLTALCTRCCRPFGRWRRAMKRVRLWQPFRDVSEAEVHGIASFLLQCRATASIRILSETDLRRLARPM